MSEENIAEESASELRQMQKLQEYRKLVTSLLLRWIPLLAVVFLLGAGAAATMVYIKTKNAGDRFESQTNLVFYPKEVPSVKALDCDQVMRIISRRSMSQKVASELGLPEEAADWLFGSFQVWQDPKNRNFYAIKATAPTGAEAIRRVNAFADAALRAYAAYRLDDLRTRRETVDRRKAEIAADLARVENEENALATELGVPSPMVESERLAGVVSRAKHEFSEFMLKVAEDQARLADIRKRLGDANPDILNEADSVRHYTDKLRKCDEEIDKLALIYTEENPKLALAIEERKGIAERYSKFLEKYGMKNLSEGDLVRIDELGKKSKAALADLERHVAATNAFQLEITENTEKLNALLRLLPKFENYKMRRDALKNSSREVEASDADVRFLEATVTSELTQLERSTTAIGASALTKKKLIAIVAVGGILSAMVAFMLLVMEIFRGRIHNAKELEFYFEAEALGETGRSRELDDAAFIRFRQGLGEGKKVFLAPLNGAENDNTFVDGFLLQCSLSGIKALVVEIVRARDFVPNEEDAMFTAICYRGDRGKLPVIDPAGLSAMEITMLEADLVMLLSDFDLVVLKGPGAVHCGVLADQLTRLCDVRLVVVKPRRTFRSAFRQFIEKEGKKTMSIAIRVLALCAGLGLAGCYPDRFTGNYEQYPDLVDETSAVVDESGMSEGQRAEQYRILKELEDAPPEVYRLNAGDRLKLVVYDHPDISSDVTITPDGHLGIVFLGQVHVANLTLAEACKKIEQGLDRYLKKPAVGLTPLEISSQSATIAGGVNKSGIYTISSDMRLADLYSKAGGSGVRKIDGQDLEIADMTTSYIFRDGKALPVDFTKAIYEGDKLHNVRLRKNDYVYIGVRSELMVCVLGDVKMPRKQLYAHDMGLIELLTNAGWLLETHWKYVIIIRGGVANPRLYKVDVDAILAGKRANVLVQPGDVVYVPHDNISEYNVFIRKLLPTGQLFNMLAQPFSTWTQYNNTMNNGGN